MVLFGNDGSRIVRNPISPAQEFVAFAGHGSQAALHVGEYAVDQVQRNQRQAKHPQVVQQELAAAQGSNVIRLPMNREDTAAYIGANRSALSRELAKMKEDGLIDYRKNEVRILRQ